jgi:Phage integrase family
MVPLINDAGRTLRWFVQDVWGHFGDDHTRPGAALFPSERRNADGSAARVGDEALRSALAAAAVRHLPDWPEAVTPHVLRHFCASQLYLGGMDLIAIQAVLGHAWVATTLHYVHQGSGIAPGGRETPGHQVIVALERYLRPVCGGCLSRTNTQTIPSDARCFRQKGCRVGVQANSLAAARLPLLGRAAHALRCGSACPRAIGAPKRCMPQGGAGQAFGQFQYLTLPLAPMSRTPGSPGRTAPRRATSEGIGPVRWNLRLAAANRGIWKASECQRMLAERGW